MMIGASGTGRSPLLSVGWLKASSSVGKLSSLWIGWSDGNVSGRTPAVEPKYKSVWGQTSKVRNSHFMFVYLFDSENKRIFNF